MNERMRTSPDTDVRKWTTEAGLEEIDSLNLLPVIRNTRQRIIKCVQAMLEKGGSPREHQSAASAIGTLTVLARRVHWENPAANATVPQKSKDPSSSA